MIQMRVGLHLDGGPMMPRYCWAIAAVVTSGPYGRSTPDPGPF